MILPRASGIYKITNLVNGKFYIGSSSNIRNRWSIHLCHLRSNKHVNRILLAAWHKYGDESFKIEVLELCGLSNLIDREQYWIDLLLPEYNLLKIAGSPRGYKSSAEKIAKLSAANKGKSLSIETREKISASLIGKKRSADVCRRLSESRRGKSRKPHTDETKARIRASLIGRVNGPRSEETKNKISASHIGMLHSVETKLKISASRKGLGCGPMSDERKRSLAIAKAKFSVDEVKNIRLRASSGETHRVIASSYGVTKTTIGYVVRRHTYAWVG